MANCTVDMGLAKEDVQNIYDEFKKTIAQVRTAIVEGGAFNYQMFASTHTPTSTAACASYLGYACKNDPSKPAWQTASPLRYELTKATKGASVDLKTAALDLATFLLIRGEFAWIGHGWIGCTSGSKPANKTQVGMSD
jgi:hypothetical protein